MAIMMLERFRNFRKIENSNGQFPLFSFLKVAELMRVIIMPLLDINFVIEISIVHPCAINIQSLVQKVLLYGYKIHNVTLELIYKQYSYIMSS